MKYSCILLFLIIPFSLFSQFKVSTYTESKIVFTQSTWDSVEIKKIVLISDYGADLTIDGISLNKKKDYKINLSELGVSSEYKKATITYIEPGSGEEKEQIIKIKMKSKWVNPYGESMRCQAITRKGTQCSRYTTSKNGYCWQHGGD